MFVSLNISAYAKFWQKKKGAARHNQVTIMTMLEIDYTRNKQYGV